MKTYGLLAVCLIACLLVGVAEPRRSRGGSSRGSGKPSRGTSRRQPPAPAPAPAPSGTSLSHTGLASLSYPGYNSAAKKPVPSAPEPPKTHDTHSAGWNVNKDTPIKKEVTGNVQSAPSSNAGSHSYPASGGQSGASGSHAYPASGGLSGAPAPAVGGQHSYPASGGNSGTAGQQHSYPVSGANSGTGGQQHGYPAGNGLSGSAAGHQQVGAPASAVNSYPVNSQNAYPSNNQPYPGHNNNPSNTGYNNMGHGAPPPPYSQGHPPAYGGAPGHGAPPGYGAPPAYGSPPGYGGPGYGGPGYGGQPSYGSHGYGGMGGYGGGGFGGGGFGGGYGNAFAGYAQPKSSFLSGNKFGLILAGLAVWNLARSGSSTNHYHYYDNNKGGTNSDGKTQPDNSPVMDPVLGELSNCTLTLTNGNSTDVIAIPCVMATSFAPNAKPGDPKATRIESSDSSSALNCTITVTTKNGTEIKTDIPCEELSKMAPKENATVGIPPQGGIGLNCTSDANSGVPGMNPCVVTGAPFNPDFPLEVIPLSSPSTTTVDNAIVESTSTSTTSTSTTTTTTTTAVPEETIPETTLKPSE